MFVPVFRILGRWSWVGSLVLDLFGLGGLFSNWCTRRQRHNLTDVVKGFTDLSLKPRTRCEKPLILFNVFDKWRKWGPGRWELGFLFLLFFLRFGVCESDRAQIPAAPACQKPSQGPFLLTSSTFLLELHHPLLPGAVSWKKREIGKCPLKTVTQPAPPHLGHLPLSVTQEFFASYPTPASLLPVCTFSYSEINPRKMILAPFCPNCQQIIRILIIYAWTRASRAGVTPNWVDQMCSPWWGQFLTLSLWLNVFLVECWVRHCKLLNVSRLWTEEEYCSLRQHMGKWQTNISDCT